jgi:hypothetical protein
MEQTPTYGIRSLNAHGLLGRAGSVWKGGLVDRRRTRMSIFMPDSGVCGSLAIITAAK